MLAKNEIRISFPNPNLQLSPAHRRLIIAYWVSRVNSRKFACSPARSHPICPFPSGQSGRQLDRKRERSAHRWAGITPAYLLPACVCVSHPRISILPACHPASLPPCHSPILSAFGCRLHAHAHVLMVSCRRNGRKGRKSGFCVRNDFCVPHLNEGKLKWIPFGLPGDEFKSTSSARIDFRLYLAGPASLPPRLAPIKFAPVAPNWVLALCLVRLFILASEFI